MSQSDASPELVHHYPPGFRQRRGVNWTFIGLLYTTYYMCRYNLGFANGPIRAEYGFSKEDIGWVISISAYAYGVGQIINGLLTDRIGGKRAMLIGAVGTIIFNIIFGMLSYWAFPQAAPAAHVEAGRTSLTLPDGSIPQAQAASTLPTTQSTSAPSSNTR